MKTTWLSLLGLLVMGTTAIAQEQPNSAQYHAVHNPNSPPYVGSNQQPAAPPVRWADRWGAIASDRVSIFGIVSDKASKREAESSALSECRRRAGAECQITFTYNNQCAAVAAGNNGTISFHAPTLDEAIDASMKKCNAEKGGGCRVYYSGCSLPVQVQ